VLENGIKMGLSFRTMVSTGAIAPVGFANVLFANRQPDPPFQFSETGIFTPEPCKASLAAIRFIRLATKPSLLNNFIFCLIVSLFCPSNADW
jgi:hypothetical protein